VPAWESPDYRRLSDQLSQAQFEASRQLGQARWRHAKPPRRRTDPRAWVLKWVFIPLGAAALLIAGAVQFGPALAAARGHGTTGYFVAEVEHCGRGGCGWTGEFVVPDGRVTLQNVSFLGPHGTLYRGDWLEAMDAGNPGAVYARHGSRDWLADLAMIIVGSLGFGLWARLVLYRRVRRRARRDAFLIR
jgi:hypothetical protein